MTELTYEQMIDRYLDGETDAAELTKLLLKADALEAGWRLLALRLVESRELTNVFEQFRTRPHAATTTVVADRTATSRRLQWLSAACAVCFSLAAFWLGRSSVLPTTAGPVTTLSEQQDAPAAEDDPATDATTPPQSADSSRSVAADSPDPSVADPAVLTVVGFAHLHQPRGARPLGPVLTGARLDPVELLNQSPPVSEEFRRRAHNKGLQVEPVRHVMSLKLADGQTLAVPLDSIGLRYVGHSVL